MTTTFGALLRQLRRRAQMTQADLAAAVGYSVSFISSLEQNTRRPDVHSILQHFVPALALQDEPHLATHLLDLAAAIQGDLPPTAALTVTRERRILITETNAEPPTNLPTPPTPLIGREQTVKMLCDRLLGHQGRLLTLVGPPGVGKTRLALAVAADLQPFHPDGVYFVPLVPVSDPDWVASALVNALAIADSPDKSPEKRLIEFLRRKELLLLLDNFEQLLSPPSFGEGQGVGLVATLLAECPRVRILVTSRERLHLRAEQRYPVQPLAIAAACELFVQRAQAVDPDFVLTLENQPIIEEICQRLDCLPLAIELSAAHVDLFSPQALLARQQDHSLDLLTDGARDLPAHHATLRWAIQRSYVLLNEQEQLLFRTLGVFVGGFDLAVVAHFGFAETTLQALVNKSLVSIENRVFSERRFLLLETLREYALEQLAQANEVETVQRKHALYYFELARRTDMVFNDLVPDKVDTESLHYMEREVTNLSVALGWVATHEPVLEVQFLNYTASLWHSGRYLNEGSRWIEAALPRINPARTLDYAGFLQTLAITQARQGNWAAAQTYAEKSLALFRQLQHPFRQTGLLNELANILLARGAYAATRAVIEESVIIARDMGKPAPLANALWMLRVLLLETGDRATARTLLHEIIPLWRSLHGPRWQAQALRVLAQDAFWQGKLILAHTQCKEALQLYQSVNDIWGTAWALILLGQITWCQGDKVLATALLDERLTLTRQLGSHGLLRPSLLLAGLVAQENGNRPRARALLMECLILLQEDDLLDNKGSQTFVAYLLSGLAGLLESPVQAARLLGMATRLLTTVSSLQSFTLEHVQYERILAAVRTQLVEVSFATAWAEGQTMSLEEAVKTAFTSYQPTVFPALTKLQSTLTDWKPAEV
jgi:predicted ATPase